MFYNFPEIKNRHIIGIGYLIVCGLFVNLCWIMLIFRWVYVHVKIT